MRFPEGSGGQGGLYAGHGPRKRRIGWWAHDRRMVISPCRSSSRWLGALLAGVCLLSACGGGGDASPVPGDGTARALAGTPTASGPVVLAEGNTPGTLRSAVPLGRVTVQQVVAAIAEARVPAIAPVYDVDTFRLTYVTRDSRMQPIVASGLLAVPRKGAGAASPVISYQHPDDLPRRAGAQQQPDGHRAGRGDGIDGLRGDRRRLRGLRGVQRCAASLPDGRADGRGRGRPAGCRQCACHQRRADDERPAVPGGLFAGWPRHPGGAPRAAGAGRRHRRGGGGQRARGRAPGRGCHAWTNC